MVDAARSPRTARRSRPSGRCCAVIFRDRQRRRTRGWARILARASSPSAASDVVVLGIPRGGVIVARSRWPRPLEAPARRDRPAEARGARQPRARDRRAGRRGRRGDRGAGRAHESSTCACRPSTCERTVAASGRRSRGATRSTGGARPAVPLAGRTVVIVDDGVATGLTAQAAALAVARQAPSRHRRGAGGAARRRRASSRAGAHARGPRRPPFEAVGRFYDSFPPSKTTRSWRCLRAARLMPRAGRTC